ncbi:MAG: DUF2577 family protein [Cetobacterium sp.]|uniref:DUF2577 family protein n=1 Tax=Cetobacterium sp. TaxID=2071632 RepID=UPI003F3041B7
MNIKRQESILEFAIFLKSLTNPSWLGAITGEVESPPPNLSVKIHNKTTIYNNKILISSEKLNGYKREFSLDGKIVEENINLESSSMTKAGQGPHEHILKSFKGSGNYSATGIITWTDTLKKGDKVLLIPTNNHEYFYLIDKIEILGENNAT